MREDNLRAIALVLDTSGSISSEILGEFLSAAQDVLDELRPGRLVLVSGGNQVETVDTLLPGDKVPTHLPPGGGTDFRPAFKRLASEPELAGICYLTDMAGVYPDAKDAPSCPVLWAAWDPDWEADARQRQGTFDSGRAYLPQFGETTIVTPSAHALAA
jgi:predicted metal-dependent peptidase